MAKVVFADYVVDLWVTLEKVFELFDIVLRGHQCRGSKPARIENNHCLVALIVTPSICELIEDSTILVFDLRHRISSKHITPPVRLRCIPKEPAGLSNNARPRFGPPRYKDAKFAITTDALVEQKIELR